MTTPTSERTYTPWWLFAAVVLAGLTAFGVFVGAASSSPLARGLPSERIAARGSEIADGKLSFTVLDVRRAVPEIGDPYFGTSPQGSYTVVTLAIQNISAETVTFDGSYVVGIDTDGNRIASDRQAQYYANDDGMGMLTSIAPDAQIVTSVAFDVPAESRLVALQCHDSVFSRGSTVSLMSRRSTSDIPSPTVG